MILNAFITLLASTTAFAAPAVKRQANNINTQLQLAGSAVARHQILAQNGGNASFAFDFANPPAGAAISSPAGKLVSANPATFPELVSYDFSLAVVTVSPCGLILPHIHPRADEFIFVTQGEFLTQFIAETGAALVENKLNIMGSTLFPRGSIHLEYNPTCQTAQFIAAFNGNDPGISFVANNFFALDDQLVLASVGGEAVVSGADLASIRKAIPPPIATAVEQCLKKCGINPYVKRSLKEVFGQ